jgi:DNA-binding response OmpR family regulator
MRSGANEPRLRDTGYSQAAVCRMSHQRSLPDLQKSLDCILTNGNNNEGCQRVAGAMDRILVIDDDVEMCTMLAEYLESEGLHAEVAHDGETGLKRALSGDHSVIVLDVMLPGMNGLEVLRRLRAESNARVVLLTARGEELDRIVGLEVGADDYVPKPFSPRELLARIRAILRRPVTDPANSRVIPRLAPLVLGDIEMDFATRSVRCGERKLTLTAVEFNLLELLLRSAGQVVTREQMAKLVLGRNLAAFDRSVDVHVSKLRQKLGEMPSGVERIKAIRSVGYIYCDSTAGRKN